MDKQTENIVKYTALVGAGYFLVVKPVMNALGINPADTAAINAQEQVTPNESPFNPLFQPSVDLFNQNPSYTSDGSVMSMEHFYQLLKQWYDDNDPNLIGEFKLIASGAETINNALAWYHITTDDLAIMGVLNSVSNQRQLSELSSYFLYNFNKDLLQALKGSLFSAGLSPSDLALVVQKVNNLPE